jgi:hypothetical protein
MPRISREVQVRSRFSLTAVSCWVLLGWILLALAALAPGARAQAGSDIFVTPVPNAPFSGVVTVERSIVQPNGVVTNLKTVRAIGRDSQGRIHNESRALVPVAVNQTPPIVRIHIYDPQSRINTFLNPQQRTFWIGTVNRPPATEPPDFLASPTAHGLPASQFAKEEDLGNREIAGLQAHGVRETQMIPVESSGAGKEIFVTNEYWYSDDLRMNLVVKHSDPRTGSVSMTVTQVTRIEPDPSFFEIPADYKPAGPGQGTGR